jgi:hypothetical protein
MASNNDNQLCSIIVFYIQNSPNPSLHEIPPARRTIHPFKQKPVAIWRIIWQVY